MGNVSPYHVCGSKQQHTFNASLNEVRINALHHALSTLRAVFTSVRLHSVMHAVNPCRTVCNVLKQEMSTQEQASFFEKKWAASQKKNGESETS